MQASGSKARKVLVVDDSPDNAELLRTFLSLDRHEVEVVHDGHSALDAATSFGPDTVLLDIGLPGIDGLEVARRLRQDGGKHMLLIALTGHTRPEDRHATTLAGFDHHLSKPIDLSELRGLLTR